MHFQLFLPDRRGGDPAALIDVGLADFVAGAEFLESSEGPNGMRGLVVAWRKPGAAQMGFRPDAQTWLPAAASAADELPAGRYWIGFWNASPPLPRDLARPYPQAGPRIVLGDSQEWVTPAARELTADLVLADDGSWRFEVQRRFHAFYLEYLRWIDFFAAAGESGTYPLADAADFALSGLRINYRLTAEVASFLRLFNTDTARAALFAILGIGS